MSRQQRIHGLVLGIKDPRRPDVDVHLLWHGEVLDHRTTGCKVAPQHGNATFRPERILARTDDLALFHLDVRQEPARLDEERPAINLLEVLAQCLPSHRHAVKMQELPHFHHHRRHPARIPEVLHRIHARRLGVCQDRHLSMNAVEVVDGYVNPCLACDCRKVDERIGGPTDRRVQHDGVLECLARQDLAGAQVHLDQLEDLLARRPGNPQVHCQRRRDQCRPGQRQAERLGKDLTGRGTPHELARTTRWARALLVQFQVCLMQFTP